MDWIEQTQQFTTKKQKTHAEWMQWNETYSKQLYKQVLSNANKYTKCKENDEFFFPEAKRRKGINL